MTAILSDVRSLLESGLALPADQSAKPVVRLRQLLAAILVYGLLYGAVMGMFAGVNPDRWLQILYSAIKVPLLLLATFAISLPSFFVINTLLGLRSDFGDAVRSLMITQAVLTIILASLSPLTLVWYAGSTDYPAAIALNAVMFGIASFAAQAVLRRHYRTLIARDPRHRLMLRAWIVIFAFVGIQMGWTLRPFIGDPSRPPAFFRPDAWSGNAYMKVWEVFWSTVGG